MTIAFKGRHICRCFNPNKPAKFHFKCFCLNDARTGYLKTFYMYCGKAEQRPLNVAATAWPVMKLTSQLPEIWFKGHILCLDNWFHSLDVTWNCGQKGIHTVGTCRTNRKGLPPDRIRRSASTWARGDFKTMKAKLDIKDESRNPVKDIHEVYLTAWIDNKPVHILSTHPTDWDFTDRSSKQLRLRSR